MKKVKIIAVVVIALTSLFLNVCFIGNVEDIYAANIPKQALPGETDQCWLNFETMECSCPIKQDMACVAICSDPLYSCGEVIIRP